MNFISTLVAILALLWLFANLKRSRPDGELVKDVPHYRTLMGYIMPTRSESIVFFDLLVDAEPLLAYLEEAREKLSANVTHCLVAAAAISLSENPRMNRFVVGRRLYQRRGRFITFSMKRKKLDSKAKLAAVKLEMLPGETFADLVSRINAQIGRERSGEKTFADKEFDLFMKLPRAILVRAVGFFRWLDYHNLLPGSFIATDGMYTSLFLVNLGSLDMGSVYHHLWEWGTCSAFLAIGAMEDRALVEDGKVVVGKVLPVRGTYDERVDDGLTARAGLESFRGVLENPFERLGCLAEDGSDRRPLDGCLP